MTEPTAGWTTRLTIGLAEDLHAAALAVWRPVDPYEPEETGISLRTAPQTPDRVIVLTPYPVTDDPALADVVLGMQIRFRGRPGDTQDHEDLGDAVFAHLHGATGLLLGGIPVTHMWRQSASQLGRDDAERWERADNYYLQANRPTAHRPD